MKKTLIILIASWLGISANAQTWDIGTPNPGDVKAIWSNDTLYMRGTGDISDGAKPWDPSLIKNVVIEEGITNVGNGIFLLHDNLASVTLPSSLISIRDGLFIDCAGLTSVTIPEGVTNIEYSAFQGCSSLPTITIPSSVKSIGNSAFAQCTNLTSVTILNGATSIGSSAFMECTHLTSISIPESVESIENSFIVCENLASVTIGKNLTNIGDYAFAACKNLTAVTNLCTVPQNINSNVFVDVDLSTVTLSVPCGSLLAYRHAPVWQDFGSIKELPCQSGVFNVKADFSCPGQVTVTYDLETDQPTDATLYYSSDGGKTWLIAQTVTGDLTAQTSGTGKTIVWDNRADKVLWGNFKLKVDVPPPPECVEINGVCWATRNVDAPGTFTKNPEDTGMLYQWNSSIGWSATDPLVASDGSTWDDSWNGNNATTWEIANNVCPAGFRVPTSAEIQLLINSSSQWVTENGVNGMLFGSGSNTIFVPTTLYRLPQSTLVTGLVNYSGFYWSSDLQGNNARQLYISSFGPQLYANGTLANGQTVRCVKE